MEKSTFNFGKKLATILVIKGKGNFLSLDKISKGDKVQISTSNGDEDAPLNSLGTFEVTNKEMFVTEVNRLATSEGIGLVLVSIQA